MHKDDIVKYLKFKSFQSKKFYHFLIIPVLMIAVYLIVYYTDNKVYGHAMYIPIIYASFTLGVRYSTIIGVIGGIILGPLIPFSVVTGEEQEVIQWVFRLIMFSSIGFFSGFLVQALRKNSIKIIDLFSLDSSTNLPNIQGLQLILANLDLSIPKTIISIIINNHEILLDLFGYNLFSELIIEISKLLNNALPNPIIVHPSDNKLWISTDFIEPEEILNIISQKLNKNIIISDVNFYIDYYLGLYYPKGEKDYVFNKAFINADVASRYAIKNQLMYSVYDKNQTNYKQEFNILGSFSKALTNGEIYLNYQPIINLNNNKIEKLEALIRWNHPKRGYINPDDFIPLIEQTQLIHKLTNWVFSNVIEKIEVLRLENIKMNFSINISAKNLYDPAFVDTIIKLKKENNIEDNKIELEITESKELIDNNLSHELLLRLRDNGFLIAIDDFGKGYSSLSSLHQLPATTLKIDKYFSKQLETNPNVRYVVEGVIAFAHKLGLSTIFEGIETKYIDSQIRGIKSDFAQGYYYSKPLNFLDVLSLYKSSNGYITK